MIKPEDISPELAKSLLEWTSIVPRQARSKVAEMANELIEAGVVSSPCYCLRWNGELQTHSTACPKTGLLHPKLFAGKPWADDQEHYRGQGE